MEAVESITVPDLVNRRIGTYLLLSRLFRTEITPEFLGQLKGITFDEPADAPEIAAAYKTWRQYLDKTGDNTLLDLARDYVRAFIGSDSGKDSSIHAAYPYESVYTSPLHLVMQEARDKVLYLYREEGLGKSDSFIDPEDHIALELEFMVHLSRKFLAELEADNMAGAKSCLEKQRQFLDEHLLNWVPMFTDEMLKHAQEDLYLGLAKLTLNYLKMDREVLAALADELK